MTAYYNEIDPYAAQWLRNLIAAKFIAGGDVDERSIVDVRAGDLAGYDQCHFFAGIGGWSYALRLAEWPDDRPVWTGSCPCQPFSVAGKRQSAADERHLWPHWFRLIGERKPAIIFGEQVAAAIRNRWLDAVAHDLEGQGYAFGASVLPACAISAPHIRERLWFVADSDLDAWQQRRPGDAEQSTRGWHTDRGGIGAVLANSASPRCGEGERRKSGAFRHETRRPESKRRNNDVANATGAGLERRNGPEAAREALAIAGGCCGLPYANGEQAERPAIPRGERGQWSVEPDVGRVAHGIPARAHKLRALGNAIVPQVAAEFIAAFRECQP